MFDIVDESLTICETAKKQRFSTVRTFGFTLLDPCSETVLAGEFAAGWTHSWFFDVLEADVTLEEGKLLTID